MHKIILLGAFDRYNYGDNLMPILFEMYVQKYAPSILDKYKFEYAAISQSDLAHYDCLKTKEINSYIDDHNVSAVIVIGGEVLCATNASLFLHMQENELVHKIFKRLKKIFGTSFNVLSNKRYSARWEYPYIPASSFFKSKPKVIFNTVGGRFGNLKEKDKVDVVKRLKESVYISVRDTRTMENLSLIEGVELVPDSAYLMSDLINNKFLSEKVSSRVSSACDGNYFVFQAAPKKAGASINTIINELQEMVKLTSKKVLLLPIGYASGHDDVVLLKKINNAMQNDSVLLHDLNVWEIMFVIKNAEAFFGTSLHGVITAMSFGVPHFGINKKVAKLDSFLKDWSVYPFNKCYEVDTMSSLITNINQEYILNLNTATLNIIEKIKVNNEVILRSICN